MNVRSRLRIRRTGSVIAALSLLGGVPLIIVSGLRGWGRGGLIGTGAGAGAALVLGMSLSFVGDEMRVNVAPLTDG